MSVVEDCIGKEYPYPVKGYYTFIHSIKMVRDNLYEVELDINTRANYEDTLLVDDLYNGISYYNPELEGVPYIGFGKSLEKKTIYLSRYELFKILFQIREDLIKERKGILQERGIKELVHFTSIRNLQSILNEGICSRKLLDVLQNGFDYNDPYRLDHHENYVNTSITFPNYKMFYKVRMQKREPFVVLGISSSILLDRLDSIFVKNNAASNISQEYFSLLRDFMTTNYAFKEMFSEEERSQDLPDNMTTDPQAEVLIRSCIDPKYISKVYYAYLDSRVEDKLHDLCSSYNIVTEANDMLYRKRIDWK